MRVLPGENDDLLDRMVNAVERVRQRLQRASAALEQGGVPYAVIGGNAVAAWVATVDEAAVRNTQDVDLLIRRADFERVRVALTAAGFVHRHAAGLDLFLDGPGTSPRQAVHIAFANEIVKPGEPVANPDVGAATRLGPMSVLNLEALVTIKLTAYRDKDRTHLRDLIDIGLIDATWLERVPKVLAPRLQALLDTPEG